MEWCMKLMSSVDYETVYTSVPNFDPLEKVFAKFFLMKSNCEGGRKLASVKHNARWQFTILK